MPSNVEYRIGSPRMEWDEEKKARFRERYAEVKDALAGKYGQLVSAGLMDKEESLDACCHEILSTLAREFGLALLTFRR